MMEITLSASKRWRYLALKQHVGRLLLYVLKESFAKAHHFFVLNHPFEAALFFVPYCIHKM